MLLKDGAFVKNKFFKLFIANLIGWIITISADFFDSLAAGLNISADAVAGIEIATPIDMIQYAIAMLLTYSIGVLYSRELGRHNKEQSKNIAGMGLIVGLVAGVIVAITTYIFAESFVGLYDCSSAVAEYAITFIKNGCFRIPVYYLYWTLYQLILFDGDEIVILAADVAVMAFSLIIPNFMASQYGFVGLSHSKLFIYILVVLVLCIHFLSKRNSISFKPYFSMDRFIELIKLSSPYALSNIYIAIIDIIFNGIIVMRYSDAALPAYTVVNYLMNLAECLTASIYAGQIFISNSYGEHSYKTIENTMKLVMKASVFLSLSLSVVLCIVAPIWPMLFGIETKWVYDLAIFAGRVVPLTYVFSSFIYTLINYYPIIERPLFANTVAFAYMFLTPLIICLPLSYLFDFKIMTIGFTLTPILTIAILYIYFLIRKEEGAPFFIPKSTQKEYYYNAKINLDNIIEIRDALLKDVEKHVVDPVLLNKISVVVEDILVLISSVNKKDVVGEVTLLVDDKTVRLIIKDNGKIFDVVKEIENCKSLRAYTIDRLTSNTYEKANDVAISFNRNVFYWEI